MTLINITRKHPAETVNIVVGLQGRLACSELLTGTPTVIEWGSAALTIASPVLNTLERWIDGQCIPTGTAVEFSVAGGSTRQEYTIRITVSTDASPTQTLVEDIRLRIL